LKNFFYKVVSFCDTNKISPKKPSTFFEASYPFAQNDVDMKFGKYWFHLQKKIFIANFHVLGFFIPKKLV
jgi:hypothetical protein